ncbi:MAG: RimK/LysX family protein [Gammaproteobacteria bacterium]|nr:RimK/LysX family protein [Gammaproteobacteria bacterium]
MKRFVIILAAAATAGCAALEDQQQALQDLRGDVRDVATDVGEVDGSLNRVSDRMRRFERSVDARLDSIEEQLARPIELPPPVCEFPDVPSAEPAGAACEALEEVVEEAGTEKMVVGSLERIRITPPGITINARIDTGADSNSLSATNMVFMERDGEDWVRFDLQTGDATYTLERRVSRFVRVFQQSDAVGARRPVVQLRVQLGQILGNFEFNLSNRTHLKHAVILGRSLLMDLIVVDVAQEFVQPLPDGEG